MKRLISLTVAVMLITLLGVCRSRAYDEYNLTDLPTKVLIIQQLLQTQQVPARLQEEVHALKGLHASCRSQ